MEKKIAVIGGGACGMMAAVTAAGMGARVTVYEGNDRVGKKILVTGNGKCNLGNEALSAEEYHGGDKALIASCLSRFGTEETKRFFDSLGLLIKEKNGCLYPACEQAAVVLDVLRYALEDSGANIVCQTKITDVKPLRGGKTGAARGSTGKSEKEKHGSRDPGWECGGFEVSWQGGRAYFDSVILACGGRAAPKTGSDGGGYLLAERLGLAQKQVVPALTALHCREEYCKALAGVRADARVRIMDGEKILLEERGELQLVEYGISGIPVFQLSGQVNYFLKERRNLSALIDFLPDFPEKEYERYVEGKLGSAGSSKRTVETFFTGMLHKKLMMQIFKLAGLKPGDPVKEADQARLREVFFLCRNFTFHVTGSNSFDQAQVCAGGVKLSEVTRQLEAVRVPGLYLAGELLDVDGKCGGYNLQWAWTSGYIAGRAAAEAISILDKKEG